MTRRAVDGLLRLSLDRPAASISCWRRVHRQEASSVKIFLQQNRLLLIGRQEVTSGPVFVQSIPLSTNLRLSRKLRASWRKTQAEMSASFMGALIHIVPDLSAWFSDARTFR